jgi:phosphatidylglycerol lysyltransferase
VVKSADHLPNEPPSRAAEPDGSGLPWEKWWRKLNAYNSAIMGVTRHPFLTAVGSLVIFLVALRVINQELTKYSLLDLEIAINNIGVFTLIGAVLAAAASYGALVFSDRFALSMLGKRLPYARTARASLAAYALANTLGYSWATAATARQRLYRKWGLLPGEIGSLSFVTGNAVQIGGLAAAGLGLLMSAREVALHGPLNWSFWFLVGLLILVPAGLWLAYARKGPKRTEITGAPLYRPTSSAALAHLSSVILDWIGAAGILFVLLPNHGGWSFPAFLAVFVLAGMLGALSGAPGGLGVFEAAILTLAPVSQDTPGAAIALLLYRLIYNIIPLGVATIILGLDHAAPAARPAAKAAKRVGATISTSAQEFAPRIAGILVFATGFGMLGAIATPPITARLMQLDGWGLSLLAEFSNLLAAVIGTALLFISVGLWKQRRPALFAACILLVLGTIISVLKGLSWEEAFVIMSVLAILITLRDGFEVQNHANNFRLSPGWLSVIMGSLATIVWIASFSYPALFVDIGAWRDFAIENDAGRTQRALISVILTSLCLTVFQISQQSPDETSADVDKD